MEHPSTPAPVRPPLDPTVLADAAKEAAEAAVARDGETVQAIDAAVGALGSAIAGLLPSVFVVEHGRLWLVSQRGYAVVPDGIKIDRGVMGRAVRLGRAQLAVDVRADPDYIPALPGVVTELAVPLRAGGLVVGAFNLESERALPAGATKALRPLTAALVPLVAELRADRSMDVAALARLFVHLGSIREPGEIAALAAASLPRVLPVEMSQVALWDDTGKPVELASWVAEGTDRAPLSAAEIEGARVHVDSNVVCQVLDVGGSPSRGGRERSVVWLPLRANGADLGAMIAIARPAVPVDPGQLDTAALFAAHVAASLDAAVALERERRSAVTDPLTEILNRRGLEERAELALARAQEQRLPLSLLVMDCDDFKDINDRAGHEFGDALLHEVARVLTASLPPGAEAARLGGDEFVVMLPGAGADAAEAMGESIRRQLAEGLTDAGFPLRVSAGIATYPFDGATSTTLLRAADQALYAAKNAGKDRVASFRELLRPGSPAVLESPVAAVADPHRRGRSDGSILADVISAAAAIESEETAQGICNRLCKALVFVVGATACSASRVVGDYLVDATEHALREMWLGDAAAYRISDFPLTAATLRTGEPRAVSFADGEVDPAEAFILRELGMNALLMLPLRVAGEAWGLVELYDLRLRQFTEDDVAIALFLTARAERRLQSVASDVPTPELPVYELPADDETSREPGST
jgi:diguanylate cyclase (GGDEF)-like protein